MHFNDLQQCSDEQFVLNCYHLILGREPDGDGFAYHLTALRSGRPRVRVARGFLRSREGRIRGEKIEGLRAATFWRRVSKVSLIAVMRRRLFSVGESSSYLRRIRTLEDASRLLLYLVAEEQAKGAIGRNRSSVSKDEAAKSLSPRALEIFEELRG